MDFLVKTFANKTGPNRVACRRNPQTRWSERSIASQDHTGMGEILQEPVRWLCHSALDRRISVFPRLRHHRGDV